MSLTSLSTNFALGLAVPFIYASLPFLCLSKLLSANVPRNKCAGFTHKRLSHLWQMHIPFGKGKLDNSQDIVCECLPRNDPYPQLIAPFQFQHSSSPTMSTFSQNDISIGILPTWFLPNQGRSRIVPIDHLKRAISGISGFLSQITAPEIARGTI